jgi:hypothetical protein
MTQLTRRRATWDLITFLNMSVIVLFARGRFPFFAMACPERKM